MTRVCTQSTPELPPTRQACRARIAELEDAVAAIKAQIAAADLDRQQRHGSTDPRWFHRAKTALRHKQREIVQLQAHMASLRPPRDGLKDCLIEVLRADYDESSWSAVMTRARELHLRRESP